MSVYQNQQKIHKWFDMLLKVTCKGFWHFKFSINGHSLLHLHNSHTLIFQIYMKALSQISRNVWSWRQTGLNTWRTSFNSTTVSSITVDRRLGCLCHVHSISSKKRTALKNLRKNILTFNNQVRMWQMKILCKILSIFLKKKHPSTITLLVCVTKHRQQHLCQLINHWFVHHIFSKFLLLLVSYVWYSDFTCCSVIEDSGWDIIRYWGFWKIDIFSKFLLLLVSYVWYCWFHLVFGDWRLGLGYYQVLRVLKDWHF